MHKVKPLPTLAKCLCLAITALQCHVAFAQKDTLEPPAVYRLYVNGKPYRVQLGKEFKLNVDGEAKLKLLASPTRRFTYAGLDFAYPMHFAFEAEFNQESKIWTMEASDVTLMVVAFPKTKTTHKEFAQEITSAWEESNFTPTKLKVAGATLNGTKAVSLVAGFEIHQFVYSIPTSRGSRLLVIQDSLDDEGKPTDEYKKVVGLFRTKFRVPRS